MYSLDAAEFSEVAKLYKELDVPVYATLKGVSLCFVEVINYYCTLELFTPLIYSQPINHWENFS